MIDTSNFRIGMRLQIDNGWRRWGTKICNVKHEADALQYQHEHEAYHHLSSSLAEAILNRHDAPAPSSRTPIQVP